MAPIAVGSIVINPKAPQWGPGKVLAIEGLSITAYWRDVQETKPGDSIKRVNTSFVALELAASQSDTRLDNIPPLETLRRGEVRRLTWDEGERFFFQQFPAGFLDREYLARERDYKWAAHQHFVKHLGNGRLTAGANAGDIEALRTHVLGTAAKVNLLSVFEAAAFRDALKDDAAASRYFAALGPVLDAERPDRAAFEAYIRAVTELPVTGKASPAKWPVLTLLPYLARPDAYIFLKPEVTQACAQRLAFNLSYVPQLNWLTYSKLLQLSELLLERLRPRGARDLIDVQSFIWVIAAYDHSGFSSRAADE